MLPRQPRYQSTSLFSVDDDVGVASHKESAQRCYYLWRPLCLLTFAVFLGALVIAPSKSVLSSSVSALASLPFPMLQGIVVAPQPSRLRKWSIPRKKPKPTLAAGTDAAGAFDGNRNGDNTGREQEEQTSYRNLVNFQAKEKPRPRAPSLDIPAVIPSKAKILSDFEADSVDDTEQTHLEGSRASRKHDPRDVGIEETKLQSWVNKADRALDDIERNPDSLLVKTAWSASKSAEEFVQKPSVKKTASLAASVGKEAIKVATPLVTKAATLTLKEGSKFALRAAISNLIPKKKNDKNRKKEKNDKGAKK